LLFHFFNELQAYRINKNRAVQKDDAVSRHLALLVDFIEVAYASTRKQLKALLKHQEITNDLLWALFKPNMTLYTTCPGTKKPRCVKYDFGEEKRLSNGIIYYSMQCRYLDFDGKIFGEVSTELPVVKFRGTQRIDTLSCFPLQFHPDESSMTADLVECGRRFVSLMGSHHRHCRGDAFFIQDDRPFQAFVDCRIMVDAAFFHKINPNYSRPRIIEPVKQESIDLDHFFWGTKDDSKTKQDEVTSNGLEPAELKENELVICCPTVPGFSFGDKLWCNIVPFPLDTSYETDLVRSGICCC
jgi:hypothetical protein